MMKKLIFFFFSLCTAVYAQVNIGGVVNDYTYVIDINLCDNTFGVDDASMFSVGDTVLIIQMQGATISSANDPTYGDILDYASAGDYEKNVILSKNGNEFVFEYEPLHTYDVNGSVQIVSIPYYNSDVNITTELTADPWDGQQGGILVFETSGTVTLQANIDVSGLGFRGGENANPVSSCSPISTMLDYYYPYGDWRGLAKGEGIANFEAGKEWGRGKQANGGGGANDHNAGGGGGSNGGAGGTGGINDEPAIWLCQGDFPGIGGVDLDYTTGKIFMGGGGGSGHSNNGVTITSGGGNGGGMVMITAQTIVSTGDSILANGANGAHDRNDGASGGGGGGTICLNVSSLASADFLYARGGMGGSVHNDNQNRCFGPGGGGGGGVVVSNISVPTVSAYNLEGEIAGTSIFSSNGCNGSNLQAEDGMPGKQETGFSLPISNIPYVSIPLAITNQPIDSLFLCFNDTGCLTVDATGVGLTYEWQFSNDNVSWSMIIDPLGIMFSGVQDSTMCINGNTATNLDSTFYRVVITDVCGDTDTSITTILRRDVVPSITGSPLTLTECEGTSVFFNVSASPSGIPLQWQTDDDGDGVFQDISPLDPNFQGVHTTELDILSTQTWMDGDSFRVIAYTACDTAISPTFGLNVNQAANFIQQPTDVSACPGDTIVFQATIEGVVSYQWQADTGTGYFNVVNNSLFGGAQTDSLVIRNIGASMYGMTAFLEVVDECGDTYYSSIAELLPYGSMLVLSSSGDLNLCQGVDTFLYVETAAAIATYQWQVDNGGGWVDLVDGGNIMGVNDDTLFLSNISTGQDGFLYRVILEDHCGSTDTLTPSLVQVAVFPAISSQPSVVSICENDNVTISITVSGAASNQYQWQIDSTGAWEDLSDGGIFAGSNTSQLSITNAPFILDGDSFRLIINNLCSSSTSGSIHIEINQPGSITQQPMDAAICLGGSALFSVGATGMQSYQWQIDTGASGFVNVIDDAVFSGSNSDSLQVTNAAADINGAVIRVLMVDECGNPHISSTATLSVDPGIQIDMQPIDQIVCQRASTFFTFTTDLPYVDVHWQTIVGSGFNDFADNTFITGTDMDTLTIQFVHPTLNNTLYRAIVEDACGQSDTTMPALLTILPISIVSVSDSICSGDYYYLPDGDSTNMAGTYVDTLVNIVGCDSIITTDVFVRPVYDISVDTAICFGDIYTLPDGNTTSSAGLYVDTLISSNGCDSIIQTNLSVYAQTVITSQPADSVSCPGETVSYLVVSQGNNLTYQWQENTGSGFIDIPNAGIYTGAQSDQLDIVGVNPSMNGYQYRVIVLGDCGTDTSSIAMLGVTQLSIDTEPDSVVACMGDVVSFSFVVSNAWTYQWQFDDGSGFSNVVDGGAYLGSDSSVLTVDLSVPVASGTVYQAIVTDSCGHSDTSRIVELFIKPPIQISTQPTSQRVCVGDQVLYSVVASGSNLTYQWQEDRGSGFANIVDDATYAGSNTAQLTISSVSASFDGYQYQVLITDDCGNTVTSDLSNMSIISQGNLLNNPVSDIICEGQLASFSVSAQGIEVFEWQFDDGSGYTSLTDDGNVLGSATSSLTITSIVQGVHNGNYQLVATDTCGNVYISASANLQVLDAPTISTQPTDVSVCEGDDVQLSVVASGNNLSYQWQVLQNGSFVDLQNDITYQGVHTDILSISTISASMDNDQYQCVITNTCGSATTQTVTLSVNIQAVVINQLVPDSVCLLESAAFSIEVENVVSYQWHVDTSGQFLPLSEDAIFSGVTSSSLQIASVTASLDGAQLMVSYTDECGIATQSNSIQIVIIESLPIPNPIEDLVFCETDDNRLVDVSSYGGLSYVWSSGEVGPIISVTTGGEYIVAVEQTNGCSVEDTIQVEIEDCLARCVVTFPTAFSPNNDGNNDMLQVLSNCPFDHFELTVANRWGEIVFYSDNPAIGWDGTYHASQQDPGAFVWTIHYKLTGADSTDSKSGVVTLIR